MMSTFTFSGSGWIVNFRKKKVKYYVRRQWMFQSARGYARLSLVQGIKRHIRGGPENSQREPKKLWQSISRPFSPPASPHLPGNPTKTQWMTNSTLQTFDQFFSFENIRKKAGRGTLVNLLQLVRVFLSTLMPYGVLECLRTIGCSITK